MDEYKTLTKTQVGVLWQTELSHKKREDMEPRELSIGDVDIRRMSMETGIPEESILRAFGVSSVLEKFKGVTTINEALDLHARTPSGSDEEKAVIFRLAEFYKKT